MIAGDDTLHTLMMVIAADVARQSGAAADAIRGAFAIRMADARRHAAPHELAAIMQGLADARDSALAAEASRAEQELHGRQQAALVARGSQPQPQPEHGRSQVEEVAPAPAGQGRGRTDRDTGGDGATARRAFGEAGKAVTRRVHHDPAPKPRRRGSGDMGRAFRPAARAVMHRRINLPDAGHAAMLFLADTLDWLNLWDAGADELHTISNPLSSYPEPC